MIMQLRKGKSVPINFLGESNVILDIPNIIGKTNHPCEKNIKLYDKFILQSSKENELILDPFVRTVGSCVLSCINNNRKCIAIDCDENFYKTTVARVEKMI